MKNKLFLIFCGLVLTIICGYSVFAKQYNGASTNETYSWHFNGSGWNTPYYDVKTVYRGEYNQSTFGGKYKFDVTSALGSKSFTVKFADEYGAPILNTSMQMPTTSFSTSVDDDHTERELYVYDRTAESITIRFKKPFTATWSYDLAGTIWPFILNE